MELADQTRGRWLGILVNFGINEKILNGKHHPCPLCGGRDRFRFDNSSGDGNYFCSGCGAGQGIKLIMRHTGMDFKTCAESIRNIIGGVSVQETKAIDYEKNAEKLKKIHAGLKKIQDGDPVSLYLSSRGLYPWQQDSLYYHPSLPCWDGDNKLGDFPAMVAAIRTPTGELATYHITYLQDGKKAQVPVPRKNMPVAKHIDGGAVRLFAPCELPSVERGVAVEPTMTLGIAEGIETALAVHRLSGSMPVWAAVSANGMATVEIPENVKTVMIYADSDANFTGQAAAYTLAKRLSNKGIKAKVSLLIDREPFTDHGIAYDFNDFLKDNK